MINLHNLERISLTQNFQQELQQIKSEYHSEKLNFLNQIANFKTQYICILKHNTEINKLELQIEEKDVEITELIAECNEISTKHNDLLTAIHLIQNELNIARGVIENYEIKIIPSMRECFKKDIDFKAEEFNKKIEVLQQESYNNLAESE